MGTQKDKYDILELDYSYVLTIKEKSVIIDNIGYHKVQAKETLFDLYTNKSYKDCFNYLLQEDRKIEAWSKCRYIKPYRVIIKKGDDNEPAKRPRELNAPIQKNQIFDWISYTRYKIEIPTNETIDRVRSQYWWDSKDKPAFCFYHGVRKIQHDSLNLYVPKWLSSYNYSHTYDGFSLDGKILDEKILKTKGLDIHRFITDKIDPREHFKKIKGYNIPVFAEWDQLYTRIGVEFSANEIPSTIKTVMITVGLLMPNEKEWKKQYNYSSFKVEKKLS